MAAATLPEVLEVLRARRDHVRETYKVELLGVFGSLARGDARPDSDADVLAHFLKGTTLFRIAEVSIELEKTLGRRVDLADRDNLRAHMRTNVERDFVPA